jgi:hypothetical protein
MESPVGSPSSRGNIGTPLFDRIGACAHKIASGGGAPPRFDQTNVGVGPRLRKFSFPRAGTAITE